MFITCVNLLVDCTSLQRRVVLLRLKNCVFGYRADAFHASICLSPAVIVVTHALITEVFFTVFFSPSRQTPGGYFKLSQNRFLSNIFPFIVHPISYARLFLISVGLSGRENRSTQRKYAPMPLSPP
jgi:hypothetical protein